MKQAIHHLINALPYAAIIALFAAHPAYADFALGNVVVQAFLFIFVVIIPTLRTERMSYVDLGWPLGLFLIGVQVLVFADEIRARSLIIAALYLFAGGRMSAMMLIAWRMGHIKRELPRYQYQRLRWQRRNWHARSAMAYEVAAQGLANMSVLAVPAVVLAANPSPTLHPLEIAGCLLWIAAFAFEFVADAQKMRFGARMRREGAARKGAHCGEGLWRYSRHPNYFGEWMVWNALALITVPTLLGLAADGQVLLSVLLAAALAFMSYVMYVVLTRYSGAVPAEYYSVQKRPGYAEYQRTTSMFFPRPPRP